MLSENVSSSQPSVDYSVPTHPKRSVLLTMSALGLLVNGITCILEALLAIASVGISLFGLLPLFTFALLCLLTSFLFLRRIRGAHSFGLFLSLFTFAYLLIPATRSGLLQPTISVPHFALLVLIFASALVTLVTGIAATLPQASPVRSRPGRWLPSFLSALAGLVVGMILITSIIASAPATISASTTSGMPTVHTSGGRFLTNIVLVPKGASLLLTDDDGEQHIIANGSWSNGTPHPQVESGAPVVRQLDLKTGSKLIGPFTTAGVFHFYCPIHLNMNLTVVVQ